MAKLTGPLFSLGASGQVAKTLVYLPWKGLNNVRKYVVPSNPQTADQVTQRGYFTDAVTRVHWAQARSTFPMVEADTMAYALKGSTRSTPRTWFNEALKMMVDCLVASKNYPLFYAGSAVAGANQVVFTIYAHLQSPTNATIFYGTSKTALINSVAATKAGSKFDKTIAGLTTGVKYYFQLRADAADPAEGSYSGIYYATPT